MVFREYIADLEKDYQLVGSLSNKNGAVVLKMRHQRLKKDIVVKHYTAPVSAYDTLKNLHHDNLPEVYDTMLLDDGQMVLEEFVDGITVAQVLEGGKYSYRGMKRLVSKICLAVSALHEYGIIHRDIKPENVLVTAAGEVKLIDLNASRRFEPSKDRDTVVLGTIGYASPEQLGIAQCDERTDIYALGVLINVMLTGEHPSRKLARGRAGKIVLKCTQIDPDSRYQTVEKLINAL